MLCFLWHIKHRCLSCQGNLPNKIQCFCGKFRRLSRTGSKNLLEECKILPEPFHESMQKYKRQCFSCKTAAQSTRVCNADLLATTLLPSKLNTTSFQGAPASRNFASMCFSAIHFCGPLQNMAFPLLASEDAQKASLLCFYLRSRALKETRTRCFLLYFSLLYYLALGEQLTS